MSHVTTIGIDLAKNVFQICGLNGFRQCVFNKAVKRTRLLDEIRRHPDALIAMEACGTSHHWARVFIAMGHTVRLIPAQHVKALVHGNKNDANDALAIAESVFRPDLHTVQVKSLTQQDVQTLLRIRSRYKDARRTNAHQLRGLLSEYGLIIPVGITSIPRVLPGLLEDAENGLTVIARQALYQLLQEHYRLSQEIAVLEKQLKTLAMQQTLCQSLMTLRGIGPITALALFASVGKASQFNNARHLAAWLGLVPRQHGTGGRVQLGSISKRGNTTLRTLLIHGARTVMNWAAKRDDTLSVWVKQVAHRRGKHKAIVALANKTARMVWIVLHKGVDALPPYYCSMAV